MKFIKDTLAKPNLLPLEAGGKHYDNEIIRTENRMWTTGFIGMTWFTSFHHLFINYIYMNIYEK